MTTDSPVFEAMIPDQTWIAVAQLLRPQGRRGELLADPLSDLPGLFIEGQLFHLGATRETARPVVLEHCWRPQGRHAGRLVLKLAGIDSISSAEFEQKKELYLREDLLPPREEGTFLVRDLVGCAIFDGPRLLGTVAELQFALGADGHTRLADAADLLAVQPAEASPETESVLVPFVKAWLAEVDVPGKRIVMHLPPGLFDLAEAE